MGVVAEKVGDAVVAVAPPLKPSFIATSNHSCPAPSTSVTFADSSRAPLVSSTRSERDIPVRS